MLKKLKPNMTIQGISSLEMLMRVLLTRPSGLTGAEVAKRTAVAPEKTQLVTVMRDGFLREVSAGQLVIGDILVLATVEKAPVAVVELNANMTVVAPETTPVNDLHGVVVDPRFLTVNQVAKVKVVRSLMTAFTAMMTFSGLLMVSPGAFAAVAVMMIAVMLVSMVKLVQMIKTGHFLRVNGGHSTLMMVELHRLMQHLQVEPGHKAVVQSLIHAGNAEIPQPIFA